MDKIRKFKFAIVEDQVGMPGWGKVMDGFLKTRYLSPIPQKITKKDTNDFLINYEIFSPDNQFTFAKTVEYLQKNQQEFDVFFIDLDFSKNQFVVPEDGFSMNRPGQITEFGKSNDDIKNVHWAGIELIDVLRKDNKPKIFYTGTEAAAVLLNFLYLIRSRWDDVMFKEINTEGFKRDVEKVVDAYMASKQLEVIRKLGASQIIEIKRNLESGSTESLGKLKLSDPYQSSYWTISTLFPKQYVHLHSEDIRIREQAIKEIGNMVIDWQSLMYDEQKTPLKGIFGHFDSPGISTDDLLSLFDKVSACDYGVKDCGYVPLSLTPTFKRIRDKITQGREELVNRIIPETQLRFSESTAVRTLEDYLVDLNVNISAVRNIWMREFGIYPVDIAFITHIIGHNAKERNNTQDISFTYNFIDDADGSRWIKFIWHHTGKGDVRGLEWSLEGGLGDIRLISGEKYRDICKLVCDRYRGEVVFKSGAEVLTVSFSNTEFVQRKILEKSEYLSAIQVEVLINNRKNA